MLIIPARVSRPTYFSAARVRFSKGDSRQGGAQAFRYCRVILCAALVVTVQRQLNFESVLAGEIDERGREVIGRPRRSSSRTVPLGKIERHASEVFQTA